MVKKREENRQKLKTLRGIWEVLERSAEHEG